MESVISPAETPESSPRLLSWSFDRREELRGALLVLARLPFSARDWALCTHTAAQRRTIFSGRGRESIACIVRQVEAHLTSPEHAPEREQFRLTLHLQDAHLAARARQAVSGGTLPPPR